MTAAVEAWANESQYYEYTAPTGFSEQMGHFTQLLWKATTQVGCAVADCPAKSNSVADDVGQARGWFVVCEYAPPGNVVGDDNAFFKANVQPVLLGAEGVHVP